MSLLSFHWHSLFIYLHSLLSSSSTVGKSTGLLDSGNFILGPKWQAAYGKSKTFVAGLTNQEKVKLTTGSDVPSANWTALQFKDGDQGLIGYFYASGFAETSTLVQTFDRDLIYLQMNAVGDEIYKKGFQVVNGPTSGPLGRSPWGGRLVEGLGQD
ncbi:uncharacterized protein ASPGLDRAFT_38817 [Aspergillus glaucus CBS 516.65]|uniref:beta-glucosidase n=1 Tax=Aspergillus glaucus CBS 516.65 TaxID=1160497 RepID=A0A1L9VA88_ASPGL|nr:hypothetical protein ASPGLDRAFT_38817 [Aspergillus glaucus CBS 516.65]OJJ80813.1 hypothetical protein ASPGLDRAFT_38817 [Aspergillus glaucus CBS 516.65]